MTFGTVRHPVAARLCPVAYQSKVECPSAISCIPPYAEQKPIYCSHATREILCGRFPGLAAAMRVLEEECTTLLKLASPVGAVDVHVTAYNANHCLVRSALHTGSYNDLHMFGILACRISPIYAWSQLYCLHSIIDCSRHP